MGEIKAIQTYYNGYKFRSRLEARWAVFFDTVGIKYQYEPEGFQLPSGWYLPDFFLPELNIWVEVKGVMNEEDATKIEEFRQMLANKKLGSLLVLKDIPSEDEALNMPGNTGGGYFNDEAFSIGWDGPYLPCVCPACGKVGIEFDGRGWRVCRHYQPEKISEGEMLKHKIYIDERGEVQPMKYPEWAGWRTDDKGYSASHPIILNGYRRARQARFEHSEKP